MSTPDVTPDVTSITTDETTIAATRGVPETAQKRKLIIQRSTSPGGRRMVLNGICWVCENKNRTIYIYVCMYIMCLS